MALSPYREGNDSSQRSRSSSFSALKSANYLYQEVYAIGDQALIRSYSCGQVFQKQENGDTFHSTQIRVFDFVSPIKKTDKFKSAGKPICWSVPKSVDGRRFLGNGPIKAKTSLKFNEIPHENAKTKDPDPDTVDNRKSPGVTLKYVKRSVFGLILAVALVANYYISQRCDKKEWNIEGTVAEMKKNVFGQEIVINELKTILKEFNKSDKSLIVTFSGSVGVGKTFVSSIIYSNFPWTSKSHVVYSNSLFEENLFKQRYSSCGANLLIVDSIYSSHVKPALDVIEKYVRSLVGNEKLLMIIIFQVHKEHNVNYMWQKLYRDNINFHHLFFKNLSSKDVMNCFKVEMKRQNKHISDENLNKIVNENMKPFNLTNCVPGCKNVLNEVSLL